MTLELTCDKPRHWKPITLVFKSAKTFPFKVSVGEVDLKTKERKIINGRNLIL
jgi:hypothetical protein